MFGALKSAFKAMVSHFGAAFEAEGVAQPTARDMQLDVDEWKLKRRLGKNFFRKQMNPRARASRIRELTTAQRDLALRRGWISAKELR